MKGLFFFLLISQFSFAQQKEIRVSSYWGDTLELYPCMRQLIEKIGLEDLRYSRKPLHFRFWFEIQGIEVWKNNSGSFEGRLINMATSTRAPIYCLTEKEKLNIEILSLDTAVARRVAEHLSQLKLFETPSQDSLKDIGIVDDGTTIFVEYSDPSKYTFKNYDAPDHHVRKGIKELIPVDKSFTYLYSHLKLRESWERFVKTLPKGCYRRFGFIMFCVD